MNRLLGPLSHALPATLGLVAAMPIILGCGAADRSNPPTRLRMGHVYEITSPTHAFGAAHLGRQLTLSGVELDVTVFPAAQLGSESELLEQLVAGEIDLAIAGPSFLAMWHPPLGTFDAAYAFRDLEQMLEVAGSAEIAPHWEELRRRFGVRVLGTWAYGARHITSNRPIRHPDDLRGFRLRMPGAAVWQASGAALGASPMPMAFSEVYMALQQGIADGQENPVPVIQSMGFHEVQRYLSLTGHIQSSIQILINERVWQRLRADQQNALMKSVESLGHDVLVGLRQQEHDWLESWRVDGTMQIIDQVDVDAFRNRARDYFAEGFPFSELYRKITADPQQRAAALPTADGAAP